MSTIAWLSPTSRTGSTAGKGWLRWDKAILEAAGAVHADEVVSVVMGALGRLEQRHPSALGDTKKCLASKLLEEGAVFFSVW